MKQKILAITLLLFGLNNITANEITRLTDKNQDKKMNQTDLPNEIKYMNKKEVLNAFEYHTEAIKSGNITSFLPLGIIYQYYFKDFQKAEKNYLEALKYNRNKGFIYELLAKASILLENNIKNYKYYFNLSLKHYLDYYSKELELSKDKGIVNIKLGEIYLKKKNYQESIKHYLEALKYENDKGYIYSLLGNVSSKSKNNTQALEYYKLSLGSYLKQLELSKNKGRIYINLGKISNILQNYKQAIFYFKKALNYNTPKAYYNIAFVYDTFLKEYKQAIEFYKKASNVGNKDANFNIARIYHFQLKNYNNAIKYYEFAIEKDKKQGLAESFLKEAQKALEPNPLVKLPKDFNK